MFLPSTVRTPHSDEIIKRIPEKWNNTIQFDSTDLGITQSRRCLRIDAYLLLNLCFVAMFLIYLMKWWASSHSLLVKEDLSWEGGDSKARFISRQHQKRVYRQNQQRCRSNKVNTVITWNHKQKQAQKESLQREEWSHTPADWHETHFYGSDCKSGQDRRVWRMIWS